jgi:hypothetical protein
MLRLKRIAVSTYTFSKNMSRPAGLALVLTAALWAGLGVVVPALGDTLQIGQPAPGFTAMDSKGSSLSLSQYHGAHAAAFIARIPASHRLYVWLGSATESDDSFPQTDGGNLPADKMFRAAFTSRS